MNCDVSIEVSGQRVGQNIVDVLPGIPCPSKDKRLDKREGPIAIGRRIIVPPLLLIPLMMGGSEDTTADPLADCGGGGGTSVSAAANAPEMVKRYAKNLEAASSESGIPASYLAAQIEAESGWNPKAVSPVGARGLTQFMPGTWSSIGEGDPTDPVAAIKAQGKYLKILGRDLAAVPGDRLSNIFAGYNAGPGNVLAFGGVPPFGETRNYVVKIKALQPKYAKLLNEKASSGSPYDALNPTSPSQAPSSAPKTSPSSAPEAESISCEGIGSTSGKNDYPFTKLPHCNGDYSWCPPSGSPLGGYPSECVDWVLWKVNLAMGGSATNLKVTSSTFRPDGINLGNADTYYDGWKAKGWPTDNKPDVGDVVWYAPGAGGASKMGHVATVKSVNNDGTFVEEGYNGLPAPNDHKYYTKKVSNGTPSKFLTIAKKK